MANGDDKQNQTPGWVEKKQPDGTSRWYPDDKTNDQIRRDEATVKASENLLPDPTPAVKAWDWLWKPQVSEDQAAKFWATVSLQPTPEQSRKTKEEAIARGDPETARRAALSEGVITSEARLTAPLTSPGMEALQVASLGEASWMPYAKYISPLLKIPGRTMLAYFGLQGLNAMTTPQQEGESNPDALERQLLGWSAFLGSAGAASGMLSDALSHSLVKQFGLSEDLAVRVAKRVDALEKIRASRDTSLDVIETERDAKLGSLDSKTRQQVAQLEHNLEGDIFKLESLSGERNSNITRTSREAIENSKGRMGELERSQLETGSRIVSETVQVIREMEGDRDVEGSLGKPFREIGKNIKDPVTTATKVREILKGELKGRSIREGELPSGATKALGKESGDAGDIYLDSEGGLQSLEGAGEDVTFDQLTRIRQDVYQASQASKDANVGGALKNSYDKLTDIQQAAAEKIGQGKKYSEAKNAYLVFKRGLGSGLMQKWLSAEDVAHQDMASKVAKIAETDKPATRAIRTTLKAAGIDVGPLDAIIREIEREGQRPKEIEAAAKRSKEAHTELERKGKIQLKKGTEEQIAKLTGSDKMGIEGTSEVERKAINEALDKQAERVKEEAKGKERDVERHPVIPGYEAPELAGKSVEELYRTKMNETAERMRNQGIANPISLVMIMYGILHQSAFPVMYGFARGGIPEMVKSPAFQDWVIEKAGIAPKTTQANMVRRALNLLSPTLRRMERSAIPQATAVRGMPKRDEGPPTREEVLQNQDNP